MRKLLAFGLIALFSTLTQAQQPTLQDKLRSDADLNSQFQMLLNQSRNQDASFKIIRRTNVEIIQKNVNDSLSRYRKEIADLKHLTATSSGAIQGLQDSVSTLEAALNEEKEKTATISFLGMDIQKGVYHTLVWSIIAVLGVFAFILLVSFRKAKVDAVMHKTTAEEAQEELHAFKKRAMEKEQQLKRQLLDEQLKRNA